MIHFLIQLSWQGMAIASGVAVLTTAGALFVGLKKNSK
jgi:hypothetical protein